MLEGISNPYIYLIKPYVPHTIQNRVLHTRTHTMNWIIP